MTRPPWRARAAWPFALFAFAGGLLLWRSLVGGEVFVPAGLLGYIAPWSAERPPQQRPPWNPLLYDAVGQFYPWRHFAGQSVRAGLLPLWNPYQFCGTPFVANSQSAVLYPGNLLHYLLPTATAMGWTALLHLLAAACFTYLFVRELGAGRAGAALSGVAYAFCAWQVAWLHLPTFLDSSCWLPLLLWAILRVAARPGPARSAVVALAVGMALLGGHLQIAFYVLLAGSALAVCLVARAAAGGQHGRAGRALGWYIAALAAGIALSAPQVLPTLELSRRSHRAGKPTAAGYAAYTAYAVHPAALATLLLPGYFGQPGDDQHPYFGISRGGIAFNFAEGALYVGLPTLLLAACALRRRAPRAGVRALLAALAALALLMAFGTPVDALLYFRLPGFGQSGSPGRALVLWAFALATLAGLGLDDLIRAPGGLRAPALRAITAVVAALALAWAGAAYALPLPPALAGVPLAGLPRQLALLALSAGAVAALSRDAPRARAWAALLVAVTAVDLMAANAGLNPSAPPSEVYPTTPAIEAARAIAGHDRVMPVNEGWSFAGPDAVLAPNGAMVFGLRDVQGYDSLFAGRYKAFMDRMAGRDSSPPEVGNMVFARNPHSPLAAESGVVLVLSRRPLDLPAARPAMLEGIAFHRLPGAVGRASVVPSGGARVQWLADAPTWVALRVAAPTAAELRLADLWYPGWQASVDDRPAPIGRDGVFRRVVIPAGEHVVEFRYRPATFRVGLYLMTLAAGVLACAMARAAMWR
ncbi:MAG: hypothetical protein IT208_06055 [Chthonomonadales bacterium]|nr:hypothetical protein [Chthonomonadales bacterium]